MNSYQALIKSKGNPITLVSGNTGAYNTTTRQVTIATNSYTVVGYIYSGEDTSSDGENYTTTNKRVLLSPKQTNNLTLPTPVAGDRIVAVDTYKIISVEVVKEKGSTLFYMCDLRG